jgi:hypothetical protein
MYPLGWCFAELHNECPGTYKSKIDLSATDVCICGCHDV